VKRARKPERRARYEALLECPPRPPELDYLWRLFFRLRRRKGSAGMGLSPWEWPDLMAFLSLNRIDLAPWEIGVLEDLDDAFLSARHATPEDELEQTPQLETDG